MSQNKLSILIKLNPNTVIESGSKRPVYTCKPHIIISIFSSYNHSVLKCCISADEKDRDSIFTTVTTIWKPGLKPRSNEDKS
jgi:hypothetical protein